MRCSPRTLLVHTLLALAVAQIARSQDAKPLACEDEKQVQDLTAACAALVEKAEGKPFAKPPVVRIVSRDEVTGVLKEELAPQMKVLAAGQSPEVAVALLDQIVAVHSQSLLCKYGWEKKTIYLVPENFKSMSEALKNPKLLDPEMLRAMVTHELVHAHDDQEVDLGALVRRADDQEKIEVVNALLEGHAQFVTRAILVKQGKGEWFDELCRNISTGLPGMDEGTKFVAKLMGARLLFAYEDGLRFFEQLEKAEKLPTFAALAKDPPKSRSAMVNIGEYLGTVTAPTATRDFKAIVAPLGERYPAPDYQVVSQALSGVDLRGTLTGVGADEVAAVVSSLRGAWVFAATSMEGHQVICAVLEFADGEGAGRFMGIEDRVMRARDEAFKTGQILIRSATYDKLATPGLDEGICAEKRLEVAGQELFVRSTVGRVGNLVVEVSYSALPIERVDQEAWLGALLGVGKPPAVDARETLRTLAGHEAHALASMNRLVSLESTWQLADADENGAQDYWTLDVAGFYARTDESGKPLNLIVSTDARADLEGAARYPSVGRAEASKGYWLGALKKDETATPYCQDADGDGASETNPAKYGFRAWPAEYGKGGKMTFILNEEGVVYAKDLGAGGSCEAWPGEDPTKAGWVEADSVVAAELKAAGVEPEKTPIPDRVCVNNLQLIGSYIVMWVSRFGNDRDYPGPGAKLFADLVGNPDRKRAIARGREDLLVCPCCGDDEALEKVKGGDYDAGGYEVTELVISDAITHPEDPIVWDRKAAHAGKRNVLLFSGSVVQMTDEELETARKTAER